MGGGLDVLGGKGNISLPKRGSRNACSIREGEGGLSPNSLKGCRGWQGRGIKSHQKLMQCMVRGGMGLSEFKIDFA